MSSLASCLAYFSNLNLDAKCPSECLFIVNRLYGVMSKRIKLFITTGLESSNPAFLNAIRTILGQPRYWTSSSQGVYVHQLNNTWTFILLGRLEPSVSMFSRISLPWIMEASKTRILIFKNS